MTNAAHLALRALVLAIVVAATFALSSCVSGSGVGVGVGAPARWGGGSSGPPIFVGGPS
jgi:hypothetical protein